MEKFMSWFEKLLPSSIRTQTQEKKQTIPEGLWSTCSSCKSVRYRAELERNLYVCPKCGYHERIGARKRIESFLDKGTAKELKIQYETIDRLKFRDTKKYKDRLAGGQRDSGEDEALLAFEGLLETLPVVVASFEYFFIGGSMGTTVGERFVKAVERAMELKSPFICFTASGGARMQEGLFSLFQMAKTSCAVVKLGEMKLPFITILTDPTMGGVSASLAMLGDVIVAEPNALIGFTGPRVIEQTVRQKLPEGFQLSEFLLEHGHIDMIIDRRNLKTQLASLLKKLLNITIVN